MIQARSKEWPAAALLVLLVAAAYIPVCWAVYIWDDAALLTANPCIVGPLGLKEIWTTSAADICPLTQTTFWFEYHLWGLHPLPWHLVTVAFHAAGAILLWRILAALNISGAWFGAALWALHPVQVESVAWVAETKNTESALLFFASILAFLHWSNAPERRNPGFWLVILFGGLAMAAKSSTVILPAVLLLSVFWCQIKPGLNLILILASTTLLSFAFGIFSVFTQQKDVLAAGLPQRSLPGRIAEIGYNAWFYLGKLVWPYPQMTVYPNTSIDPASWIAYLPTALLVLVLAVLWHFRATWSKPVLLAYLYFLIAILPVSGLLNLKYFYYSHVADHLQYLAAVGPLALAGAAIYRYIITPWRSLVAALILAAFSVTSFHQATFYQNQETLWTEQLRHNQAAWIAHNNLGVVDMEANRLDQAIERFNRVLALAPENAGARNNLADVFVRQGRLDDAEAQLKQAVKSTPSFLLAHENYGKILLRKGRIGEASEQFSEALALNPNSVEAHLGLAKIAVQQKDFPSAIAEYRKALEIEPQNAATENSLGIAYAESGNMVAAADAFSTALRINPSLDEAKRNLAQAQAIIQHAQSGSH